MSLIVRDDSVEHTHRVTAPNGLTVEFRPETTAMEVPPSVPSLSVVRVGDEFGVGRAGMGYRDLLPDRWGGRFIASHILIRDGGPVPDYVHFHRVRFQLIFCARGWVDVVYEDLPVVGTIDGDTFHILVNHWPSRSGGQKATDAKRILAAQSARTLIDSLQAINPEANVVFMGDLNDDPTNTSVKITLDGQFNNKKMPNKSMYNPCYNLLNARSP